MIFVRAQPLPAIVPAVPVVATAVAEPKLTEPKSASGSAWQVNWLMHCDGASTIHSAELTSIASVQGLAEAVVARQVVELDDDAVVVPVTVTLACIASPGRTASEIVLEGAGTSSYQALEIT